MLCDDENNCHIVEYQSRKSIRVIRSVMGAEVYLFVEAYGTAYLVSRDSEQTHGAGYQLYMYTDSFQLYDALTLGSRPDECRLMYEIFAARQYYKKHEISGVESISGINNPADGITKLKHNKMLDSISNTRRCVDKRRCG